MGVPGQPPWCGVWHLDVAGVRLWTPDAPHLAAMTVGRGTGGVVAGRGRGGRRGGEAGEGGGGQGGKSEGGAGGRGISIRVGTSSSAGKADKRRACGAGVGAGVGACAGAGLVFLMPIDLEPCPMSCWLPWLLAVGQLPRCLGAPAPETVYRNLLVRLILSS